MRRPILAAVGAGLLLWACAPPPSPGQTAPRHTTRPVDSIAIPPVTGPLRLQVVYPSENAIIDARDSTFLLGTTGTGDATLTINGSAVRVHPNGAWIAWVPVRGDSVVTFELVANAPSGPARLTRTVRRPWAGRGGTVVSIDHHSLVPTGRLWLPHSDSVVLRARASHGSMVTLLLPDGTRIPMVAQPVLDEVPAGIRAFDSDTMNLRVPATWTGYSAVVTGRAFGPEPGPVMGRPAERADTGWAILEAVRGTDTTRTTWPLSVRLLDRAGIVRLDDDPDRRGTTDRITVGRATPGGTYVWFFASNTEAEVVGRLNDDLKLRLSSGTHAWIAAADAQWLPVGSPTPRATVGSLALRPNATGAVLRVPLRVRVPVAVDESPSSLVVTVHGAVADIDWTRYLPGTTGLVDRVDWVQDADRVIIRLSLARPIWGYRTRWEGTDLLLEVRRPPAINRSQPLEGRRIAIDPGHPPGGATGPTGLREAEANLAVAGKLAILLRSAGAVPFLTRTTDTAIDLTPRIVMAERVDADVLVSIHNNALPDGVNPFTNHGTSVFYNHSPSLPLARAVQQALVQELGLRDLGVARGDLALVRPTWQPSILTEGLYMIMPEQEAALRTDEGQDRYARGVFNGLRAFLAGWAETCEPAGC